MSPCAKLALISINDCDTITSMLKKTFLYCFMIALLSACLPLAPEIEPLPTLTPSPPAVEQTAVAAQPVATEDPAATTTPTITPTVQATATLPLGIPPTSVVGEGVGAAPSPVIEYFVANPEDAAAGEDVQLFWAAELASEAFIYRLTSTGEPGTTWEVGLEGEFTVTVQDSGRQEIYVLAVTNGSEIVEEEIAIGVGCGTYEWFFDPAPADGCPSSNGLEQTVVFQQFERGRMFRFSDGNEIVVLFDEPTTIEATDNIAWISVQDTWTDAEPAEDPAIIPPAGLFQPTRGFGKVWRETPGLRDLLGWGTGPQSEYTATYQRVSIDGQQQIYFTDDARQVLTLVPNGQGWLVAGYLD